MISQWQTYVCWFGPLRLSVQYGRLLSAAPVCATKWRLKIEKERTSIDGDDKFGRIHREKQSDGGGTGPGKERMTFETAKQGDKQGVECRMRVETRRDASGDGGHEV
jgi:hypothetical protein